MICAVPTRDPQDSGECRNCGSLLVGTGPNLRHDGEARRHTVPPRSHAAAFRQALAAARAEFRRVAPAHMTAAEIDELARASVEAMLRAGLLRARPGERLQLAADRDHPDTTALRYDRDPETLRELAGVA